MIDAAPVAAASTLLFTHALVRLAPVLGLLDVPDARKQHEGTVPMVGGLAIGFAYLITSMLFLPEALLKPVVSAGVILLLLVGAIDDRIALRARSRLLAQGIVALGLVVAGGLQLASFGDLFGFGEVTLSASIGTAFTLFFIVSLINGFNMLDGLDGLAGGVGAIMLIALCTAAFAMGATIPLAHMFIFLPGLLGFLLLYNIRSPLRRRLVFLGDAGSMVLGFMLAWSAITVAQDSHGSIYPISIVWIFGLVVLDTFATVIRRVMQRRNPFAPGRDHLHHLLIELGLSQQQVVWVMYSAAAIMAAVGLGGWAFGVEEAWLTVSFIGMSAVYYAALYEGWQCVALREDSAPVSAPATAREPAPGMASRRPREVTAGPRASEEPAFATSSKLSVITATFNSEATIADCIESRRLMLNGSTRHLIQDGGSTDATLDIIKAKDRSIDIVSTSDDGIYDALNKAVARVETDWLMFLHSDDQLVYDQVESDIAIADARGLSAISYGVTFCNAAGRIFRRWPVKAYGQNAFRYGFMLPHTGLVVRRRVFEEYGGFRVDLGSAADYEWILRVFYMGGEVPLLMQNEYLIQMNAGGASDASLDARLGANRSDRMAWEINGIRPSPLLRVLKPLRKAYQFCPAVLMPESDSQKPILSEGA